MRNKIIFLAMALLCLANFSKAENVTIDGFTIQKGETKTVAIKLTNDNAYLTAFSMTLTLPSGLTLVSAEPTDRYAGGITVGNPDANEYNICGADLALGTISGTSGDLINITVKASETFKSGNGSITNIDFITTDRQHVRPQNSTFKVTVQDGGATLVGDADNDGVVNVNDVMTIVNYILGATPAIFNFENADTNKDGEINILDVMDVVNILLYGD